MRTKITDNGTKISCNIFTSKMNDSTIIPKTFTATFPIKFEAMTSLSFLIKQTTLASRIAISRPTTIKTSQNGTRSLYMRTINIVPIESLSAIGSSIFPTSVIWFKWRAIFPSRKSDAVAIIKTIIVPHKLSCQIKIANGIVKAILKNESIFGIVKIRNDRSVSILAAFKCDNYKIIELIFAH